MKEISQNFTFAFLHRFKDLEPMLEGIRLWNEEPCGVSAGTVRGEWPSGLYSLRQVTEVKLGRVRSDSGWVTSEA